MILFLILDYASLNIKFCQGEKLMKILIIKDNKIPKINLENLLNTLITVCLDPLIQSFAGFQNLDSILTQVSIWTSDIKLGCSNFYVGSSLKKRYSQEFLV